MIIGQPQLTGQTGVLLDRIIMNQIMYRMRIVANNFCYNRLAGKKTENKTGTVRPYIWPMQMGPRIEQPVFKIQDKSYAPLLEFQVLR